MSLTFQHPVVSVYRPSKREYDFLRFNAEHRKWQLIEPPEIIGIDTLYTHIIIGKKSFLTLFNGRKLDIKVSPKVLKGSGAVEQIWYPVVTIENNGRLMSSNVEKIKHSELEMITAPANLSIGSWSEPIMSLRVRITENSVPHHIPNSIRSILTKSNFNETVNTGLHRTENPLITDKQRILRLGTAFINTAYTAVREYAKTMAVPEYVASMIANKSEADNAICPITMEPIKKASCSITSCFHVFDKDALSLWLASNETCPVCKQLCLAVTSFDLQSNHSDSSMLLDQS